MDELVKLLDGNLRYVSHEINGDILFLHVVSTRREADCPYCGQPSSRVHSVYTRNFQDLPIQDKKVTVVIGNRKMFCDNPVCKKTTFAEKFSFLASKSKKSERLINRIADVSLNVSSVTAAALLRNGVVDVGKSTICAILKKTGPRLHRKKT